jgi:hypothetical protein
MPGSVPLTGIPESMVFHDVPKYFILNSLVAVAKRFVNIRGVLIDWKASFQRMNSRAETT